jgi:1,4-dihydroxy-2-naphthoyl-CoA synthase
MTTNDVSEIFDPTAWRPVPGFEDLTDLTYHRAVEHGTVRIAFDRPEVRNAFRPHTVDELLTTLEHARTTSDPGWAAGGGHSLHVVSDLTLASREHARFKQTDADVGSFDGGFGSAYLARQVGQKFAREIFFLGDEHDAESAHRMGMVNKVVAHADLEREALEWGRRINAKSPTAQRMLKYSFNLLDDGLVGQQLFAGEATRLAYGTDEAVEGRDSFLEKREPDWSPYPWHY